MEPTCRYCGKRIRNRFKSIVVLTQGGEWFCNYAERNLHDSGRVYQPRTWREYAVAVIVICGLLALASLARGQVGTVQVVETVLCDTKEQALSILTVNRYEGYEKASARYRQLNTERNDDNEPRCAVGQYVVLLVAEIASLDDVPIPTVGMAEGFVFEVKLPNASESYYILLFHKQEKT